jgi:hypothetical protein
MSYGRRIAVAQRIWSETFSSHRTLCALLFCEETQKVEDPEGLLEVPADEEDVAMVAAVSAKVSTSGHSHFTQLDWWDMCQLMARRVRGD